MMNALQKLGSVLRLLGLSVWIVVTSPTPVQAASVTISCGAVGRELELCRSGAEAWSQATGHAVHIVTAPASSTERLALYQQLLAAASNDVDVFQIDVIWPGILARHFVDLKLYSDGAEAQHFATIVENNTVDNRLVAIPWFASTGLLYYRKDLLDKYDEPVPQTWQELTATAQRIQTAERAAGNTRLWGFVWQGRAYEGLTCAALEWVASHNGGTIVDHTGQITINNPRAAAALELAASWVGTITPPGVLNYGEEEARGVFQSGNAVFMRNWPYAWALAQAEDSPVRGKVGVGSLPKGGPDGRHAATLGGWQLAVSRYSRHPELAADLIMHLASRDEQRRRAIQAAYIPTIPPLFDEAAILAANPFFRTLGDTVRGAVARPSTATGTAYNRLSSRFWNAVHTAISGKRSPSDALKRLERDLQRLRRRGRW